MANIKLKSDFSEFYDSAFDSHGFEFRRMTTDGPNRKEMFGLFRQIGLPTPLHGTYEGFRKSDPDTLVVVHTDINKHCGEGKILKRLGDLTREDKLKFLVSYVTNPLPHTEIKSISDRYLFIGNRCFHLTYVSFEDWRSNYGDGDITQLYEVDCPVWRSRVIFPLFAIDFVGEPPNQFAIDFNCAPGTTGTHISRLIPASQVVLEIKKWFKDYFNGEI